MNWKFWKKQMGPTAPAETVQEYYERLHREAVERHEAEQARKRAEWDALPDHRKAARIEYRYFQKMARPPAPKLSIEAQVQFDLLTAQQLYAAGLRCPSGSAQNLYGQPSVYNPWNL